MLPDRFWQKVNKTPTCWLWTASKTLGYGKFSLGGKWLRAHRLAYEDAFGPIPPGLVTDHLCRNPACVNPDHLEVVTDRENTRRGVSPAAQRAMQTHCKRGHPLSGNNLQIDTRGGRRCRACRRGYHDTPEAIAYNREWHRASRRAKRSVREGAGR